MKISIVFEDTGVTKEGEGFNCYLEGLKRDLKNIPQDEWTAAELHAVECFNIIGKLLVDSGISQSILQRPDPFGGGPKRKPGKLDS